MKNRDLDALITRAFDEGDEAASSELLAIRKGLKLMGDDPGECQVSTERLRDAILNQPTNAKRGFAWGWVALPATAAATWIMVASLGNSPASPVGYASINPPIVATHKPVPPTPVTTKPRFEKPVETRRDVVATNVSEDSAPPVIHRHRHSHRSANIIVASKQESEALAMAAAKSSPASNAAAAPQVVEAPASSVAVVVSTTIDDSGANQATEVTKTNDVVLGG